MPYTLLCTCLALASLTLTFASLAVGYAPIDLPQAVGDIFSDVDSLERVVLVELRLPRALLGLTIGFSLGMTGAAMQGLLRNPLADPGVIGVSAGAAFGAVVAFYSGIAHLFALALPLGGIVGAAVAASAVFGLAGKNTSTTGLILAGVALSSLFSALTALALNLSPNPYAALEIMFWLMGSLTDRSVYHVYLAIPLMALGWLLIASCARALDALSLGRDTATSLGFDLNRIRLRILFGCALSTGAAVAVSGAIGFVGLIVPHLLRRMVDYSPGRLLVVSGFAGSILLLSADIAVRLIPVSPELKLGVMTAFAGAPFMFYLLYRLRRQTP